MVRISFPIAVAGLLLAAAAALAAEPAALQRPGQLARAVILPRQQAMLSSEIAAPIDRLPLREGERVHKGDALVEFDCRGYRFAQDAAKAVLDHAQAKLNTEEVLAAHHSSGALDIALARADAGKARADYRLASLAVDHCVVPAPFDGRVVELKVHAYETVAQHVPLLSVLDDTGLEVALVIPAIWLTWLKPGQGFTLDVDETGHAYAGRITRLGSQIDPVSQTATVYGALSEPGPDMMSGMSGSARFPTPQAKP